MLALQSSRERLTQHNTIQHSTIRTDLILPGHFHHHSIPRPLFLIPNHTQPASSSDKNQQQKSSSPPSIQPSPRIRPSLPQMLLLLLLQLPLRGALPRTLQRHRTLPANLGIPTGTTGHRTLRGRIAGHAPGWGARRRRRDVGSRTYTSTCTSTRTSASAVVAGKAAVVVVLVLGVRMWGLGGWLG